MKVYRIALKEYIYDLSGAGAIKFGARWHFQGIPIIYTSENRALASLEYLVHVPIPLIPPNLKIATVEIPDDIVPREISISDLPGNWRDYPAPTELGRLGTNWAKSKESLLLRVPSAIILHEYNLLINPIYQDIKRVTIKEVENFKFDERMFKK